MLDIEKLRHQLIQHEGLKLKPYLCPAGKLTIGVGHNIEDRGITTDQALRILDDDIAVACADLDKIAPFWRSLDDARARVLVDMCFNIGAARLSGFKQMLMAIKNGDYAKASDEMMASKWYGQVGLRAQTLTNIMRTG